MDTMQKNRIKVIEFITSNGWCRSESNEEYVSFSKDRSIGVDVGSEDVVLIGESGDFFSTPIDAYTVYTLAGFMIAKRILGMDIKI